MRHNQAVAGAVVAALLAWFDVVGCAQCVAYCWPYFGLKSFLIAAMIRSKYKNASPTARANLPAPRYGSKPYEFIGGDEVGLIFYPGAAVEAAAYAPLCRRVAEEAKATVVLARPPLRFAITMRGFRKLTARHPGIKTWAVGGHSHGGGTMGGMLVADQASPKEVRGLAMLGAVPITNFGPLIDLSARRDLEVLSLLASEDEICSPKKGAVLRYGGGLVEDMFKMLPKNTRRVVIKGGNHAFGSCVRKFTPSTRRDLSGYVRSFTPSTRLDASRRGFGDYGIQAYDGERTISLEDQQDQTTKHLVAFLKRVRKRK